MRIRIREKRQVTLPAELLDALGLKPGDSLEAEVVDGVATLTPSKKRAWDALLAVNKALQDAGITEEELIASGKEIRAQIAHERWPHLFPDPNPSAKD